MDLTFSACCHTRQVTRKDARYLSALVLTTANNLLLLYVDHRSSGSSLWGSVFFLYGSTIRGKKFDFVDWRRGETRVLRRRKSLSKFVTQDTSYLVPCMIGQLVSTKVGSRRKYCVTESMITPSPLTYLVLLYYSFILVYTNVTGGWIKENRHEVNVSHRGSTCRFWHCFII